MLGYAVQIWFKIFLAFSNEGIPLHFFIGDCFWWWKYKHFFIGDCFWWWKYIPGIVIEGDMIDSSMVSEDQLRTRIEALLEMIDARRR